MDTWTGNDIENIVVNPAYAFGILLEPQDEAFNWVRALDRSLPNPFWRRQTDQQEKVYRLYFEWLDQNGLVRIADRNVPSIVSVETWLTAHKRSRSELIPLPENWSFITRKVKEFLQTVKEDW